MVKTSKRYKFFVRKISLLFILVSIGLWFSAIFGLRFVQIRKIHGEASAQAMQMFIQLAVGVAAFLPFHKKLNNMADVKLYNLTVLISWLNLSPTFLEIPTLRWLSFKNK